MASEKRDHWIETGLVAFGAAGSIIGIGVWLGASYDILLSFVAGGGWTLVVALLVILRRDTREIETLKTEVEEQKREVEEWRTVAKKDSDSLNIFIARHVPMPPVRGRFQVTQTSEAIEAGDIVE